VREDLISIISGAVIADKIRYFEDDLLVDLVKSCHIEKEVFLRFLISYQVIIHKKVFLLKLLRKNFLMI
jgi:hypothetical protein